MESCYQIKEAIDLRVVGNRQLRQCQSRCVSVGDSLVVTSHSTDKIQSISAVHQRSGPAISAANDRPELRLTTD